MGTPSQYYVDPSLGSDTGDGTVGTPWGRASGSVVQYALTTGVTRDATNGDQINTKLGTDDSLSSPLDVATDYGTPSFSAPLIIRGYGSVKNDGSHGGISGEGSVSIHDTATAALHFVDMHLHSCGAANVVKVGQYGSVNSCEVDNTTGNGITIGSGAGFTRAMGNHVHDIGGLGISAETTSSGFILYNYLKNGAKSFSSAIGIPKRAHNIEYNIISIGGASDGIRVSGDAFGGVVSHNSILSVGGTGKGIVIETSDQLIETVLSNICEGFSGVNGIGIEFSVGTRNIHAYMANAAFNNADDYIGPTAGEVIYDLADNDNESLGASPFVKATGGASDTFAERFDYFATVDTGNVHGGAYPAGSRIDKGAVQHADPAGGGGGGSCHIIGG